MRHRPTAESAIVSAGGLHAPYLPDTVAGASSPASDIAHHYHVQLRPGRGAVTPGKSGGCLPRSARFAAARVTTSRFNISPLRPIALDTDRRMTKRRQARNDEFLAAPLRRARTDAGAAPATPGKVARHACQCTTYCTRTERAAGSDQ
jgi:hypothetical protein